MIGKPHLQLINKLFKVQNKGNIGDKIVNQQAKDAIKNRSKIQSEINWLSKKDTKPTLLTRGLKKIEKSLEITSMLK